MRPSNVDAGGVPTQGKEPTQAATQAWDGTAHNFAAYAPAPAAQAEQDKGRNVFSK